MGDFGDCNSDPQDGDMAKVLVIVASPGWGGLERVFVELANRLAERCEVSVIHPGEAEYVSRLSARLKETGTLPKGSRRNPLALLHLYRAIRRLAPDIVHTHGAKATEMVHWISPFVRTPHIATKHNSRQARIFSRVRWVTAVSEQVRATIPNGNGAQVIYNGIDARPVPTAVKPDTFTMVAVGRLDKYKGFDLLIREVGRLDFDFVLEIAGEGTERGNLESLIRELGLGDRVRLLGYREDVPELLARAHMQIVPSRTEGFSLALLEGILYSDLVLSTPVGIAPEIMPDALILDPSSMAATISDARHRYEEFTRLFEEVKARHRNTFRLDTAVEEYMDLYDRALGAAAP